MREQDYDEFAGLLADVWALKGQALTASQKAMFFRALAVHSIAEVRAGLDAHVRDLKRGQFLPMPADVLSQIHGIVADDGRPGPEEAWAIALRSSDESKTIVWTDEMAQAWLIASTVFNNGDEIGARMAFKECYVRLVDEARRARRPAAWQASLGFDPQQRDEAIAMAAVAGRIAAPERIALLAPEQAFAAIASNVAAPQGIREKLLSLRDRFARRAEEPSADLVGKRRTAELKTIAAVRGGIAS